MKFDDIFSRLDAMHQGDRRTDGHRATAKTALTHNVARQKLIQSTMMALKVKVGCCVSRAVRFLLVDQSRGHDMSLHNYMCRTLLIEQQRTRTRIDISFQAQNSPFPQIFSTIVQHPPGLPSRTILDRTYSAQRFSIFSLIWVVRQTKLA